MQEEMTQQSLALSFKAVEMTADLLYTALKTLLEDGGKASKQRSKGNTPKPKQGKQSVKELIGQTPIPKTPLMWSDLSLESYP